MIIIEDECCGCAVPGYPCMGSACPNINVKHYICDKCGDEFEKLYYYEGRELCIGCIEESLEVVE